MQYSFNRIVEMSFDDTVNRVIDLAPVFEKIAVCV